MSTARWLRFYWSPERQEFSVDGERFAHPLETNTSASHDVAHLLAAAGGLAWKPKGTRAEVSMAEFNAVLLEHLGSNLLNAVLLGLGTVERSLGRALEHSRWFVEAHYAPFPVSFDEALSRFASVNVVAVERLAAVFFRTRIFELENQDAREKVLCAAFSSDFLVPRHERLTPLARTLARELGSLQERAHNCFAHFAS